MGSPRVVKNQHACDGGEHVRDPIGRSSEHGLAPVHLLAGLPTEGVARAFDRVREVLSVRSFQEFVSSPLGEWSGTGVLLPPYLESSQLVEDWEAGGYLATRFGDGVHIGSVVAVVDCERLAEQLRCADPISAYGWGKSAYDSRTVADIVVGQVESATHLLGVGDLISWKAIGDILTVLNPRAARLSLDSVSDDRLLAQISTPREGGGDRPSAVSARIVPPWLALLQSDVESTDPSEGFRYRRARPFDPERFGEWLSDPPTSLVRGKGNVWLANRWHESFGYSCAGSVHRVFPAGRWWADYGGATWPTCDTARRRLLACWHPRFGDRRQDVVFTGVDLDIEEICSQLDSCLLCEAEALERLPSVGGAIEAGGVPPGGAGLH